MKLSGKSLHFVCNFGHGVNDLFWYILPLVLPLMLQTFGLNYGKAGGILTLYLLIIAVLSFVFGKLSDRTSRWRFLGPGFFAASAGLILSGFMPTLPLLIICIGVAGIGVSTFHPLVYAIIDERTVTNRGRAFGMYEFWASTALVAMFIVNGTLLRFLDWKQILIVTAIPGIAAAILYTTGKPEPLQIETRENRPAAEAASEIPSWVFILFLLSVLLRILGTTATMNFVPTYLVAEKGMTGTFASYSSGLLFLGGMAAAIFAGKSSDRWGPLPTLNAVIILLLPSIFLLTMDVPFWLHGVSLFFFGAGVAAGFPPQSIAISRLSGRIGTGEVFGILMALITVTMALGPILQGMLADRIGLGNAFRVFEIPLIASLIITSFLTRSPILKKRGIINV